MIPPLNTSKQFLRTIIFVTVVLTVAVAGASEKFKIRIMPLGDSITRGSGIPGGYRNKLYYNLKNLGYDIDFLGNNNRNSFPGVNSDNNGYGG